MGRIKSKILKGWSKRIIEKHSDKFDTDFNKNKEVVSKYADISCKKLRNIIAGYVTRLKKSGNY
ncbi:MAG: 30S ribosomal protein S17e [Nanoarchaeota archaeon]|nr:30S ribosomal protein S17e [Nanoarchaeota archaeon]